MDLDSSKTLQIRKEKMKIYEKIKDAEMTEL